jgi:peptide deformylase
MIITDESILRAKNEKVKKKEINEIISKLEESLASSDIPGVGLAAPQIGINKRVAIIRIKTSDYEQNINLINPRIVDRRDGFVNKEEGCLSVPGKRFNTLRFREIVVEDDLRPDGFIATDFEAVAIYHEIDHLEGILVSDRAVGKNKIGRNDLCPCGSKIKYKKCHGR